MDRVRFAIGTDRVFQGFHDGDHGMVGALVFVTADTLKAVTDHIHNDLHTTAFDKEHNAPTEDWDTLAFGDPGTILSPIDGKTPLYRLASEATIVQRFDPKRPARDDGSQWMGRWVNEDPIDDPNPWDIEPGTFKPDTYGFVISADDVRDGRSDAPLIETEADRKAKEVLYAAEVNVRLSNGAAFTILMEGDPVNDQGTTYSGPPTTLAGALEDSILEAINNLGLNPAR